MKVMSTVTFNKKTTAKQIVDFFGQGQYLRGRTAIVTGGNSGIGLETVKVLASAGARVILCSRSVDGARNAVEGEVKSAGQGGYIVTDASNFIIKQLDLNSLKSVKTFAQDIIQTEDRIDFLILNAGIMALPNLERTADGFEKQIGVNHFGHFYLYQLLEPKLKLQEFPSRVVCLSSKAHTMGSVDLTDVNFRNGRKYSSFEAYGQSKSANILFAKQLADRTKGSLINAVALHPGVISTNLKNSLWGPLQTIMNCFGFLIYDKTIPQGAATTLYGCLAPELSEDKNRGSYLVDCQIAACNKDSNDVEKRRLFWELSEKEIESVTKSFINE